MSEDGSWCDGVCGSTAKVSRLSRHPVATTYNTYSLAPSANKISASPSERCSSGLQHRAESDEIRIQVPLTHFRWALRYVFFLNCFALKRNEMDSNYAFKDRANDRTFWCEYDCCLFFFRCVVRFGVSPYWPWPCDVIFETCNMVNVPGCTMLPGALWVYLSGWNVASNAWLTAFWDQSKNRCCSSLVMVQPLGWHVLVPR